MAATVDTVRQVQDIAEQKYKYGFVTDIESETAPKGLSEDTVRFISAKKAEPEWLLEWRLKAYRHWLTMDDPTWARVKFPPIDYQDAYYYSAPKTAEAPKSLEEVDPELLRTYEKLGIPLREQEMLAGVAVDAVFDSVSVATTFKHKLEEVGVIFLSDLRGDPAGAPAGPEVHGQRGALFRQQACDLELGGLHRRLIRVRPRRRTLPDGAVDLLPHQRRQYRPVRAHPDHRRQGLLRVLSGGLHGAYARREPAPRRGRRAGRPGRRRDQVLDRAELVSGRRERARRDLQLRHQARRLPRAATRRSPGRRSRPARRSPGSTRAASCRATTRSASSTRSPSPTTASRPIPAPR